MAKKLGAKEKKFLGLLADYLEKNVNAKGDDIQGFIHEQKEKLGIPPMDIFRAIYIAILGKESGPQAGWLIEALEKVFLIDRFRKVSELK